MSLGLLGLGCVALATIALIAHMCRQERTICASCGLAFCDGVACEIEAAMREQAACVPVGAGDALLAPWCAFVESLEW